jgi:hypothetical protein
VTGSLPPTDQPAEPDPPEDAGVAGSVTGEWVEVYPPDFAPPEDAPADFDPDPDFDPDHDFDPVRVSALPTGLFAAALLLILAGSITPLFQLSLEYGPSHTNLSDVLTASAWQLSVADQSPGATLSNHTGISPLLVGIPLAVCALLVIAVVALRLRIVTSATPTRTTRTARVLGVVAAAFLAGLVFTIGMFEMAWSTFGSLSELGALSTTIGAGFWLLVVAAVTGIAAAALSFRGGAGYDGQAEAGVAAGPPHVDTMTGNGDEFGQFGPQEPQGVPDGQRVPEGQPTEWPVVAVLPELPTTPTGAVHPAAGPNAPVSPSEE